jgi:hypothetical protein
MAVRMWHLLFVGAVAVAVLTAFVTIAAVGRSAKRETTSVAVAAVRVSQEAAEQAAAANVRAAIPSMEAFYADHLTYAGATVVALREYDPGLDPSVGVMRADQDGYCIRSTVDGEVASGRGPGGTILAGGC